MLAPVLRVGYTTSDYEPVKTIILIVIFAFRAGIRYYVAKNFAVYGETGYDHLSSVNFGGSFRF